LAIVYLGLGSNIGDRKRYILQAMAHLKSKEVLITKISRIIETEACGGPSQSKFLNAVIQTTTELSPEQLLNLVKKIEKILGRKPAGRNGPRVIDIDILLYDNLKIKNPDLKIPHPRMHERNFVMQPLSEIAPDIFRKVKYANHHGH